MTNADFFSFSIILFIDDFKPASVDLSKAATLDVSSNNQVTVSVPNLGECPMVPEIGVNLQLCECLCLCEQTGWLAKQKVLCFPCNMSIFL